MISCFTKKIIVSSGKSVLVRPISLFKVPHPDNCPCCVNVKERKNGERKVSSTASSTFLRNKTAKSQKQRRSPSTTTANGSQLQLFSSFDSNLSDDDIDPNANPHVRILLEHNRKWVAKSLEADPNFLNHLSSPQKPQYLYFGCSDSRVPPNEILGLG
jgi:hypothetical protein